ncbi:MAG: glycosyltransferase family 4 protein [Bacillota bacterium]|nr:glycosyltransferase family 4 protein [Bacillota bacterium]
MKVAIVHDWLANMGGAERVVWALHELYPEAPVFTLVHNPARLPEKFRELDVRTSFLQKIPGAKSKYQWLLPLMPVAIEQFDLAGYDVVISSSHACAKGVITRPEALHICYCHTPMRYAWEFYHQYLEQEQVGRLGRALIAPVMTNLRLWDYASAQRVDHFVANSRAVAARIRKHYRREATVIHPPVDTAQFACGPREDFFLVVSRLVGYKRIDLAVEAFRQLDLPLVIIGEGSQSGTLKKSAGPNITFLGRQPDEVVRDYFSRCRAFIFPGEEDFGLTPVEAQAAGRPVIAYGRGGVLDTVLPGETGILFSEQTPESLAAAVREFLQVESRFSPERIRNHAEAFDRSAFKEKMAVLVNRLYTEHWGIR